MAARGDDGDGEDESDESDGQHTWPEVLLPAQAAREWIAESLPGNPPVVGPLIVHQAKEWGATASFATLGAQTTAGGARSGREVILKLCTLPLFATAPRLAALLHAAAPDAVPKVLAWDQRSDGLSLTLFQPFEGQPVSEAHTLAPLLEMARTLARIQVAMAVLPADETAGLPRKPVARIPELFEAVLRDVREHQMAHWAGTDTGRAIARQFALPPDMPARLEAMRPHVATWAAELAAGPWPETIDHVDLYGENAVLRPGADGGILIFDWEEAVLSAPFFSLDRLLNDARELDLGEHAAWSPASSPDTPLYTPSEVALRDAYLAALPWGAPAERERAFALAMALAPIKTAHEGIVLGEVLGWDADGSSFGTAWALARALPRWQALLATQNG